MSKFSVPYAALSTVFLVMAGCGGGGSKGRNDNTDGGGTTDGTRDASSDETTELAPRLHRISAGGRSTCAIDAKKKVHCWGNNEFGAVGGEEAFYEEPQLVEGVPDAISVSLSGGTSCALTADGEVFCWGANFDGTAGANPQTTKVVTPTKIAALDDVIQLDTPCALRENGEVWCWGPNDVGQIPSSDESVVGPTHIEEAGLSDYVSAGSLSRCVVRRTGIIYCWGSNLNGILGAGTSDLAVKENEIDSVDRPRAVDVAQSFACATAGDRKLFCWGGSAYGETGTGEPGYVPNPMRVDVPAVDAVSNDYFSSLALSRGTLYGWGRNVKGQLGFAPPPEVAETAEMLRAPQGVTGFTDFVEATMGDAHACALTKADKLFCWGFNDLGQVGRTADDVAEGLPPAEVADW